MKPNPVLDVDGVGWQATKDRKFTVKSAYLLQTSFPYGPHDIIWKVIQRFRGLQRIRTFLWLVCRGQVMTNAERDNRDWNLIFGAAIWNIWRHRDAIVFNSSEDYGSIVAQSRHLQEISASALTHTAAGPTTVIPIA
ncbi:hypothetical protein V6N12_039379 [Hibiscus sabdariffa]|uniref:Reverse transcriptase zinc-binding domain-containing protein n=1 Tax=Hibiscus sabdariffa TaxID=183260 RepID=A0ABR2E0H8_9ROSI